MAPRGYVRQNKGGKKKEQREREREGEKVSRERERERKSGVGEKRNGGNGVLINWRVIKSRSDTPWVESSRYTSKNS